MLYKFCLYFDAVKGLYFNYCCIITICANISLLHHNKNYFVYNQDRQAVLAIWRTSRMREVNTVLSD
jgi:hypothetical protein